MLWAMHIGALVTFAPLLVVTIPLHLLALRGQTRARREFYRETRNAVRMAYMEGFMEGVHTRNSDRPMDDAEQQWLTSLSRNDTFDFLETDE